MAGIKTFLQEPLNSQTFYDLKGSGQMLIRMSGGTSYGICPVKRASNEAAAAVVARAVGAGSGAFFNVGNLL